MVVPPGFEPELTDSKSVVLPLHHGTIESAGGFHVRSCIVYGSTLLGDQSSHIYKSDVCP